MLLIAVFVRETHFYNLGYLFYFNNFGDLTIIIQLYIPTIVYLKNYTVIKTTDHNLPITASIVGGVLNNKNKFITTPSLLSSV